ncbi:helix-turn-helix domain-containing protein [Pelagibius sp. Alg239-R121]|uniref:helix-turn-helix domain-containing protein n=1 Tax=Pelagibius sp. Alg239-R121 TaxID=2993448 RepID=UPI0024A6DBFA|nr:helix-turn-helix transcriptional regulator [Pelagibius sp. Alg239-R121]
MRAARALLKWSIADLAERSGVSVPTIQRMESRGTGSSTAVNVDVIRRALETAGIEFIAENGGGAGVRFKERAEE